jgi:zinc protease
MGYLLDVISPAKVDGQRDVVKNERRQSYENRPYGKAYLELPALLYPAGHPYSWTVIGSMEDLSAASHQDVIDFFKNYYIPANASLCIAGDIDLVKTRASVEKWFKDVTSTNKQIPFPQVPEAKLSEEKRMVLEDKVQLPRLMMVWLTPPAYHPGNAEADVIGHLLTDGKNSRLYKRLVYDMQIAQSVSSYQDSKKLGSELTLQIDARPGVSLGQIEKIVKEEIAKLQNDPPSLRELQRVTNQIESSFLQLIETSGAKADQLNSYYYYTGNPDYFNEDLSRYKSITPEDVSAYAKRFLQTGKVVLSVVPEGKKELAQ